MPPYDEALALFHEWTQSGSLRRHGYAVEAAMEAYARQEGHDVHLWRVTGLLHDMDYERHPSPDEHPRVGVEVLRERGYPDELLDAILGHAPYTGTPRTSRLSKTLFAVDELSGLVVAAALVRPGGLDGMTPKSIRKKMKDKGFAAAVSREDILQGADELGVDLDAHLQTVIDGVAARQDRIFGSG
jgi:putative nucleotidyltransferase with HDIG domain